MKWLDLSENQAAMDSCCTLEHPPALSAPMTAAEERHPHLHLHKSWLHQIEEAIHGSCRFLRKIQYPEGYWWLELESNVSITAEYMMLFHLLKCVDVERERRMVRYLLREQRSDGSWGLYYGDDGDLSTTVEAYFALKLAGENPRSLNLRMARDFILARGGIESSRVFTKIWLALFGQYPWKKVPSMPVEMVLFPPHSPLNIYEFSSWARSTIVPLSVTMAIRPVLQLPRELALPELYLADDQRPPVFGPTPIYKLFTGIDRLLKWYERHPFASLRRHAIKRAETWILDHQEESGDWGGIQPAMVYSVLALHYLGYPLTHEVMVKGLQALENFCLETRHGLRLQSCVSPVWDTALNCLALLEAGIPPDDPTLEKAARWLLRNQVMTGGDWQIKNCCAPGGWAFEFSNSRYPDVDDSAVVLMVLHRLIPKNLPELEHSKSRGLEWCLSMQSSSGGWAAFDKDNVKTFLNWIPFADHGAMVDPPTADITGRMLELMGTLGYDRFYPHAVQGIEFIRRCQEDDGAWWGRWGVNYIYGTWSVLRGLAAIGEDLRQPYIQAALEWLKGHQNADGGWGETCESYVRPELRGTGPSTPSQTAWALLGLLTAEGPDCPEVRRGIRFLLDRQQTDGSWEELHFTGTGFPGHFYIRYHDYRNCFPLMALGVFRQLLQKHKVAST
jgi:squalene-hopene/tetraprenyl-beta-curcumene cyclase